MRIESRMGLAGKVAALSLLAIVVLGFVLTRVLQGQVADRALTDAGESARLVARAAIQPNLSPQELSKGLKAADIDRLDHALKSPEVRRQLARIKIWNERRTVVYSDDHRLIGETVGESEDDDLDDALAGRPGPAEVVQPEKGTETASEVGLGRLVEVYVPLRFAAAGKPSGAFEIYLSYRPIATAISSDERTIMLIVSLGLALLWAVLFRIVVGASRRLRRIATENDRLARFDPLTGLPNRTLMIERTGEALAADREAGGKVAFVLLDIERFKEVNDTLGHANGDRMLQVVAERLTSVAPSGSTVARLGADEYGIVLPGVLRAQAREFAAVAHEALESPIELDDVAVSVDVNVGIALAPDHATVTNELMQRADVALDVAKTRHTRTELYCSEEDRFDASRFALLGEVRTALQEQRFVLHYQPKVELDSGKVCGVEALIRWKHQMLGLLAPGRFMPALEQTALIGPVTDRVLELAIAQCAEWSRVGLEVPIAVNLSTRSLLDGKLPERVLGLVSSAGIDPALLTFEVTESATLIDPDRAIEVLAALRQLGANVSIDDFGTGHASFAYLAKLPADELKIDRSFVAGMAQSATDEAIVRSTIDLGSHLGLNVVAEGMETVEERARLIELGCKVGQGYLIAKPMEAVSATRWLEEESAGPSYPGQSIHLSISPSRVS